MRTMFQKRLVFLVLLGLLLFPALAGSGCAAGDSEKDQYKIHTEMVFLENGACSVLVQTDLEQPNDGVVIRDIVMDQTGLTSDKIKIVVNTGN